MRKNFFKLALALGAAMLLGFAGCAPEVEPEPITPTGYTVGISEGIENGSVRADKQTAQKDETVTLTLAANAGYKFGSISVKDAANNSVETTAVTQGTKYTFVMPESNVTVSASFTPMSYTVGISEDIENGAVSVDKANATAGETITITASADDGYVLESLSVKGSSKNSIATTAVTAGTKYTFVMPENDVTVSGTFIAEESSYTITVAGGIENGTVSVDKTNATVGDTITITATANDGYVLESLSVKDFLNNDITLTENKFTMPESDVTVNASFTPRNYTVGISAGIENGSVSADRQTAQKGQTVTLTLSAREGYELGSISVKDASNNSVETATVTTGTKYAFVMPASDVTVSASFTPKRYTVGILSGIENGSVRADKLTAKKNETVTLTLSASEDYKFDSISVKDSSNNSVETTAVTAGTEYTFIMPESDVTVSATFIIEGITGSEVFIDGRNITIRSSLWASDHEVTQAEYQAVMGTNPSNFKDSPADGEIQENRPVDNLSWYDCIAYCNKRSLAEGLTPCYTIGGKTNPDEWGTVPTSDDSTWNAATCNFDANGYRLPTEAEWEYLARGGNLTNSGQTAYSGSNTKGDVAWYGENSGNKTHEVKKKAPNALGLYDMTGNIGEWCWDWYGDITADTPSDGVSSGSYRVGRGAAWAYDADLWTIRAWAYPYERSFYFGCRVVCSASVYTVGISEGIENGSVSTDKLTAQKGQTVTLTLAAGEGYWFDSISVKDASNNSVEIAAVTAGTKYTFVMPESNVTVSATFIPALPFTGTTYTVLDTGTTGTAGTAWTYVEFGDWPQTIKADSVTVDESKSVVVGAYTYYKGSDGAWYAKIKVTYGSGYKYFKVEPIKWRVLTDNYSGKRLLLAESILVNHRYAGVSNNYANSEIRAYLNGTFWNTAFTDSEKSMIDETDVDNSAASTNPASNPNRWNGGTNDYACGTTKDKIFLLSEKEVTTTGYGFAEYNVYKGDSNGTTESSRIRMTTDFAEASGAAGWWWLRSPFFDYSDNARCVNDDGGATYYDYSFVDFTRGGVCPALTLKN